MKELWGRYSAEQKRILRLTGILVCVLLILGILYGRLHGGQPVLQLQRPDPGEPEEDVALDITLADDAGEKGTMHWEGKLAERQLPAEEAEELIARAFEQIEEEMFYEQEDDGHVVTGLKIPKSVGVVQIHCTADPEVFDADWKVIPGRIREETIVALDLYATAGQVSKVLQRIVVVRSAELPPMERALMNLTDRLQELFRSDPAKEVLLPEEADGFQITYMRQEENPLLSFAGLILVVWIMLFVVYRNRNEEAKKARQRELELAYADFVSQFVILLGAGMTLAGIFRKLAAASGITDALGTEIRCAVADLENGRTEKEVYQAFGRRTESLRYIRFSSILTQNLRKGTGGLEERLNQEMLEAMQERKMAGKAAGEVAGTKILVPMMVQLMLILLLVMIPVFMSV